MRSVHDRAFAGRVVIFIHFIPLIYFDQKPNVHIYSLGSQNNRNIRYVQYIDAMKRIDFIYYRPTGINSFPDYRSIT